VAACGEATREVRVPTPAADATHTDSHVEASINAPSIPSMRSKEIASPTDDSSAQYLIHLIVGHRTCRATLLSAGENCGATSNNAGVRLY